jgi:hypothetical protein
MSSRRAKIRAAVIGYFVFFNGLAALPTPGEASPERLTRPFERAELQRWADVFRAVGIDTDPEQFASGYLAFSRAVERARAIVLMPIEDYVALTQTRQGWRLFGTPDREIHALRITAHSSTGDQILYESGDPVRRWNAAVLEYRRIRAGYRPSRTGPPPTYVALAERLSQQVFASMPHVQRVTVAFVPGRVLLPGETQPSEAAEPAALEHALEFVRPRA